MNNDRFDSHIAQGAYIITTFSDGMVLAKLVRESDMDDEPVVIENGMGHNEEQAVESIKSKMRQDDDE